jgi:hypothetical protein
LKTGSTRSNPETAIAIVDRAYTIAICHLMPIYLKIKGDAAKENDVIKVLAEE